MLFSVSQFLRFFYLRYLLRPNFCVQMNIHEKTKVSVNSSKIRRGALRLSARFICLFQLPKMKNKDISNLGKTFTIVSILTHKVKVLWKTLRTFIRVSVFPEFFSGLLRNFLIFCMKSQQHKVSKLIFLISCMKVDWHKDLKF